MNLDYIVRMLWTSLNKIERDFILRFLTDDKYLIDGPPIHLST